MKKIVYLFLVFITIGVVSSCNSKSAKEAELRKQMVADSIYNDSISKEEKAAELKDKKIEFLKNFYKNTIYSSDEFGLSHILLIPQILSVIYRLKLRKHWPIMMMELITDKESTVNILNGLYSAMKVIMATKDQRWIMKLRPTIGLR